MAGEDVKGLLIRLNATSELLRSQLSSAERAVVNFEKGVDTSTNKAEGHFRRVERSVGGLGSSLSGLHRILFSAGVGLAARQYLSIADQANSIRAQLKLATEQTGSFNKAIEDVNRISAETRTSMEATSSLYATFARGAAELGLSQEQVATITKTVNQSFKVSGTSAEESGNAIRQLSQAFASGVLRGDEFNSMMENAPRLARLLADSLGVPLGQLRALAEGGQLTADKLTKALSDPALTAELNRQFQQVPVTFDDAMTRVYDSALVTFGAFDRGGQFSTSIANFIVDTSSGFGDMEAAAEQFGRTTRAEMAGILASLEPVISGFNRLIGAIANADTSLTAFDQDARNADRIGNWLSKQGLGGALLTGNSVADWWNGTASGTNFYGRYTSARDDTEKRLRMDAAEARFREALKGYDVLGNPIAPPPRRSAQAGGGVGGRAVRPRTGRPRKISATAAPDPFAGVVDDALAAIKDGESTFRVGLFDSWDRDFDELVQSRRNMLEAEFEWRAQEEAKLRVLQERQINFLAGLYEDAFRGGVKAIWRDFKDIGLAVIAQLLAKFTLAKVAGKSFDFGSALGATFTSVLGFADGGRPPVGRVSVVGERGPELFIPDVAGTIIPNGWGGGGGGVSVTINAPGATAETVAMIRREIAGAAPALISAASSHTTRQLTRRTL